MSEGVPAPERIAGDESRVPLTQTLHGARSGCGSDAADFVVSDGALCHGSKAVAVIGTISRILSDDRFRSCSSWWQGADVYYTTFLL